MEQLHFEELCGGTPSFAGSVPCEEKEDVLSITESILGSLDGGMSLAVQYRDGILLARIYDGGRYVFPMPFLLREDADMEEAVRALAEYAAREMIPLIITDIPREDLPFFTDMFSHVDACCYAEDDDSFYIRVRNECDMIDSVPHMEHEGLVLDEIRDSDMAEYAVLCRDRELNRYWGYDVYEDSPDASDAYFLDTVRREFNDGVAITLAVREGGAFVGEAVIYGFDFFGSAQIAVRILAEHHGRGIGRRAVCALFELARGLGLSSVRAEIFNENSASVRMTASVMDVESNDGTRTKFILRL